MLSDDIHSYRVLRLCAWSGIVWLALFFAGFLISGFITPPDPSDSAQETARMFVEDGDAIRAGMILSAASIPFLAPFAVLITMQMRRIEGRHSPLAWIQLSMAAVFMLEFLIYIYFWMAATFRPERDAEIIQAINDMAWLPFVGLTSTLVFQVAVFGVAILMDRRERPIFPRWFGWFNLWAALVFTPGTATVVWFKNGPFGWNGLVCWYLVVAVFFLYVILSFRFLLSAVDHQVEEQRLLRPLARMVESAGVH